MTKRQPFIAVCLASRGWGSYRTIAGVTREIAPYRHRYCWAIGQPIPDAQNAITAEALSDERVSHLWFVEDDILIPAGALAAMLAASEPVVSIDYLTRAGMPMSLYHPMTGEAVLTPMGCLLVAREVFARISDPPWQTSTQWRVQHGEWFDTGIAEHAGGQDGHFNREVLKAGYRLHVLPGWQAGHLELVRRGGHINLGMDEERLYGGSGELPWKPEPRRRDMAVRYLKSPAGFVIDIDPDLHPDAAKNLQTFLGEGWVEITKREFEPALKAQVKAQAEARAEWEAEANGDYSALADPMPKEKE